MAAVKNEAAYDRRMRKLPPRLAKQRELSRAGASWAGWSATNALDNNGLPEGENMAVFQVGGLCTKEWYKPSQATRKEHEISDVQDCLVRFTKYMVVKQERTL